MLKQGNAFILSLVLGWQFATAAPLDSGFTYQGELDELGVPANGSYDFEAELFNAATGGSSVAGALTIDNAMVSNGVFALELDFGPSPFGDEQLWLEVGVRPGASGGAFTTLTPRVKLTAAPFSLYSLGAATADTLTIGNVITVATVGGDFASLASALNSITDAAEDNPYLVQVAAGEYNETALVEVPAFVHVRGSGIDTTVITSTRNAASQTPSAATAQLHGDSRMSHLTIENTGNSGTFAIGVYMTTDVDRDTVLEDVKVEVNGAGGTGHFGVYLNDAQPTIRRAWLRGAGAVGFGSAVNAGLGSVNISGGFPQALIEDSVLLGAEDSDIVGQCSDPTGTGFGIQMVNSAPEVHRSRICGGHRGVFAGINGLAKFHHSRIAASTTGSAFMLETTGSATIAIASSQLFYLGNKHTGTGGLQCVHSYGSSTNALSDGSSVASACN